MCLKVSYQASKSPFKRPAGLNLSCQPKCRFRTFCCAANEIVVDAIGTPQKKTNHWVDFLIEEYSQRQVLMNCKNPKIASHSTMTLINFITSFFKRITYIIPIWSERKWEIAVCSKHFLSSNFKRSNDMITANGDFKRKPNWRDEEPLWLAELTEERKHGLSPVFNRGFNSTDCESQWHNIFPKRRAEIVTFRSIIMYTGMCFQFACVSPLSYST